MKFAVLDGQAHAHGQAHGQAHGDGNDHYTYLDDLLDKTFLTDYFLDRTTPASASASVASVP
jgi:hypothetical protein